MGFAVIGEVHFTVIRKIFTSKELYIIISSYLLYFLMLSAWSVQLFLIPGNRYSN